MTSAPRPDSIILIGMPGCGKSTVGVVLAKRAGLNLVDTDIEIQLTAGATLQEIIDAHGHVRLREIEEQVLLEVPLQDAVISTGGSVVYSERIMRRLKRAGPVIYLRAGLPVLQQRVAAAPPRGIACGADQSFEDVYLERTPLYERYADFTVDADRGTPDQVAERILTILSRP